MRRIIIVGLPIPILASLTATAYTGLAAGTASADTGDDHNYVLIDNGTAVEITGYTGPGGDVVIPGTIEGLPVTRIGGGALGYCIALTSVTIGNDITSIGNSAFYQCADLTSMVFNGNAPETVGSDWIEGCTDLKIYYYDGATGFATPTWQDRPCYPISAPVAGFTADATSGDALLSAQFIEASTNSPNNPLTYLWDFGDGTTSTEQNPTYTYSAPGTYTVSLTVTNFLGSNTMTRTGYITMTVAEG